MSTEKDRMEEPVTQRQLAEWSMMASSSTHIARTRGNIGILISVINSIAILVLTISYLIK